MRRVWEICGWMTRHSSKAWRQRAWEDRRQAAYESPTILPYPGDTTSAGIKSFDNVGSFFVASTRCATVKYTRLKASRMRSNYLGLLAFVLPVTATGQNAPTETFRQWARQHVHAISSVEDDKHGDEFLVRRAVRTIYFPIH
jgi:hypothetical protein